MHLVQKVRSRSANDFLEMAKWVRQIQKTHESFDREMEYVEAKWADELEVLEAKVKEELRECGARCSDINNWGAL